MLPLSHDEVVHGKGSLLGKMPGDDWQQFANLRLLLGYMWAHPGKKLLFMGGEFGQWREWNHDASLDWQLLRVAAARRRAALGARPEPRCYARSPRCTSTTSRREGFEWIDCRRCRRTASIAFLRRPRDGGAPMLVVCNFTPVPRIDYRLGVPRAGAGARC